MESLAQIIERLRSIPQTIRFGAAVMAWFLTLAGSRVGAAEGPVALWPDPNWPAAGPADVGLDAEKLDEARTYAQSAGGSGMIVRHGKAALRWGDQRRRYDIKSATKSFGATMLGVAVKDGKIDLQTPARRYFATLGVPPESNARSGWLDEITILQLATQTAGFDKPGGYEKLLFRPGTHWHYSDGGPNWLADCLTLQYGRDLEDVMFDRVFTPLGVTRKDLQWRRNQYREPELKGLPRREFGAGINADVEALSRLGYLYLHRGRWRDEQILPEDFVDLATHPIKSVVGLPEWEDGPQGDASRHYGLLWWNNGDGALGRVPRDAFWAWGLYDSLIVVVPSLDLVVVRGGENGRQWPRRKDEDHYAVLEPFLNPIVAGLTPGPGERDRSSSASGESAPYPPSPKIVGVDWAPASTTIRKAEGGDNWPITWGDDDHLYTAYGDGRGFQPFVEKKLSMGLCRVTGGPEDFQGVNLRSQSAERLGQGAEGEKASGILMVDGVLHLWVRNVGDARLGWSRDRGATWAWADWKFKTSFGCPTFLNFGRNYAGAPDDFVYVYSPDADGAYEPADRMVLARAPKQHLHERNAYEFFVRRDRQGQAVWSKEINERGAVFENPGRCHRGGVTYNAALKRYLWCQVLPESKDARGPRFEGGFGVYDAPQPWGPWTTAFFTEHWDVGPGETSSFPTKWMSRDGKTVHLVFSGDDSFSVRRAVLRIAGEGR